MSQGKTSKTLVWILMAMLILGLGGFGVTNLGGTVRTIGEVGGKDIDIDRYARALQDEMRAIEAQTGQALTFQQAQAFGLDRSVLGRLVLSRAMDAETDRIGISIGDDNLRQELLNISAFQGVDGKFDRETYRFALQQAGMDESEFEATMREDSARSLLQGAILAGVTMPQSYVDTVLNWAGEDRDFTWARLGESALANPVGDASGADLQAFYDATTDAYMSPATRQITYVLLTPAMLLDEVDVDENTIMAQYELRSGEFNVPERRLVERLAFADDAAAQSARDRLDRGETSFEALVEERGLELADVDLGDVRASELGAAAEQVFAAAGNTTVGPAPSDLGPALYRINGVLVAQSTTFEEARAGIREELAADKARREIDTRVGDVDDLLAAGATLEELASENSMTLASLDWHSGVEADVAGYVAFRVAAEAVAEGDFPEVINLEDGGIFALRLDGETDAAPIPFDQVRDQVAADVKAAETLRRLTYLGEALTPQLAGTADFAAFGLTSTTETGTLRNGFVPDTPARLIDEAFDLGIGEVAMVEDKDAVYLVRLDAKNAPEAADAQTIAARAAISRQLDNALAQDIYEAYAQALQTQVDISINQQALNAVHAQFQ